jgi:ankyrin repeat protein
MALNTVHKTAERLVIENGEAEKFEEYALSLLQLVSSAGMNKVRQLLLPGTGYWEPAGFEFELLTVAAYTNNIPLVRKLVKSHLANQCGVFGDPYKAAVLGRSFDILNIFFEDAQSSNAQLLKDRRLVARAAYNGDKEMVEFIYQAEWSPSKHPRKYPEEKIQYMRLSDAFPLLRTPNPEIFNIIMREKKLTNGHLTWNILKRLLRYAATRGWVNMIRHIFSLGGTPEAPTSLEITAKGHGLWPLYRACEAGQDEVVRLLLPYQVHPLGFELEAAASHGNISTVKLLLEHGAGINTELAKNCVAAAAANGYLGVVRVLLDAGMNPNEGDIVPMVQAVRAEHPEICQLLIERGATLSVAEAIAEGLKANICERTPDPKTTGHLQIQKPEDSNSRWWSRMPAEDAVCAFPLRPRCSLCSKLTNTFPPQPSE